MSVDDPLTRSKDNVTGLSCMSIIVNSHVQKICFGFEHLIPQPRVWASLGLVIVNGIPISLQSAEASLVPPVDFGAPLPMM